MARVKRAVHARKKHKAILEKAKGYYGDRSRTFRSANEQVLHSGQYAFRDRRAKKGEFRSLWIQRINAGCRQNDFSYSRLIAGLTKARFWPTSLCTTQLLSRRSLKPQREHLSERRSTRFHTSTSTTTAAPVRAPQCSY